MKQKSSLLSVLAISFVIVSALVSTLPIKTVSATHDNVSFAGTSYGFSNGSGVGYVDDLYAGPVGEDLDNDGDVDLVMTSPETNEVSVLLNAGNGTFGASADYGSGAYPVGSVVGDYDNDNFKDIAVFNVDDDNMSVFINDGDGTFAAAVNYNTGVGPGFIAQGFFNNDLYLDLAVFNNGGNSVSVFINNADVNGTFANAVSYVTNGSPRSAGLAIDLDNDGFDDLATVHNNGLDILFNDGDGTFTNLGYPAAAGTPYTLKAADLNGDDFPDLVTPHYTPGDKIIVYINDGLGDFAAGVSYSAANPSSVDLSDVDNDGDIDIIASQNTDNSVAVLINNGSGVFAAAVEYPVGAIPFGSITSADLNNDNFTDIIVPNRDDNNASVLLNEGDGTYGIHETFPVNVFPFGLIVTEDLNGDDKIDFVVPSVDEPELRVLLNTTPVPDVNFDLSNSSGAEAVTNPVITIELSQTNDADVTVSYAVTGGTATGGGVDYTLASGTATIAAGFTTTTIPLTIVDNATVESDETVIITISNPARGILGSTTAHTYTITNDDVAPSGGGSSGSYSSVVGAHPNGTLILDGSTIYLIKDQKRYGFRDPIEYQSYGYRFSQAVLANAKDKALPMAGDSAILKAMEGSLVLDLSDNRTVYMVGVNGTKRGFASRDIFTKLGYTFTNLLKINLSDYPVGNVINSSTASHPEGALILDPSDERTVWWSLANSLRGFESEAVFNTYGFAFSKIVPANSSDMSLGKGSLVKFRDGTLVLDGSTYYLISDGNKMPFANSAALTKWGYSLTEVINANLSSYTEGNTIR